MGERVVVGKVVEGPASFRKAQLEAWHIKSLGGKPVGKINIRQLQPRLRKGLHIGFQDARLPEHLSAPQLTLEYFIQSCFLITDDENNEIEWAREAKDELLKEAKSL